MNNLNSVKRVLVVTLSNIGDAVLTLPVFGALQEKFKEAQIDVIVGPRAKAVFESDPRIDTVYVYDKHASVVAKLKLVSALRKKKYDLVVDLRNSFFRYLAGAKAWNKPTLKRADEVVHKIDEHLSRIKAPGIETEPKFYPIWISQIDADNALKLIRKKGITDEERVVCVSPGAKSHIKRWNEGGFAKVCDRLIEEFKVKILFVGDEDDRPICERIMNSMKHYAVSVAGLTNVRELAWCIKRSKLLITNDSAPLHIAGSVGVPSIALFGPTDYRKYGPRQELGAVLYKELHCSPCELALCKYSLECMRAITAEDVIDAAIKVLNERKQKTV